MEKFKKNNALVLAFILGALLIIIYKSIDNLSSITGFFADLFSIIRPFFIGFIIAYILRKPCNKINKAISGVKNKYIAKRSKGLSVLIVYLISILVVFVVARAIFPAVMRNIIELYNSAPVYINKIISFLEYWQERVGINLFNSENGMSARKILEDFIKSFSVNELSKYAQGVITLTSGVINTFISIIVSVYMLLDTELISNSIKKTMSALVGEEKSENMTNYFNKVNDIFSKYIYCRVIDAVIMAVISTLVLTVLGVKYALALGFFIGCCSLIPYFGSIIGSLVAMLIALLTGGVMKMIWVFVMLFIMEQVDGNYIGPKIMGEVLEIRPLWVIFAVTVGGGLFGVLGMLISVPVVVVLKMMFDDYIKNKIEKRKITQNKVREEE